MSLPPTRSIDVDHGNLDSEVLPKLRGTVFHVTSTDALRGILSDRLVRHSGTPGLSARWPNSHARERGWVSLFDLRDVSDEHLRDARFKYDFLGGDVGTRDLAYLFLDPAHYDELIPWTEAPTGAFLVPHVEGFYPGDLPLDRIARILRVTVAEPRNDGSFGWAWLEALREAGRARRDILTDEEPNGAG